MILVDEQNIERTKEFVIRNLKRSGFIYGNLFDSTARSYILEKDGKIVAMANVLNEMYCTYLFPENTADEIVNEVISKMQQVPHIGGTVTGNYYEHLKPYYKLEANAINEVASLEITNNEFESKYAEYLERSESADYKLAVDTITEFQPRSEKQIENMFDISKVVGVKQDGKIISAATLAAISDLTAVVTGVFTVKGQEGKGYAKDCLHKLLGDYADNRTILIFFTNPIAKQLYLSLGFTVDEQLVMFEHKLNEK